MNNQAINSINPIRIIFAKEGLFHGRLFVKLQPARIGKNLFFEVALLKLTIPRRTRKGNHITDIRHARYKLHHPLKTQSKASMWHRSIAARI